MDNRFMTVDAKKNPVPGLHPGLNDLIRILGKQAHCASRTLIVCEPGCPKTTYSESKYHKNCGSPKKGRSWDSLCRPSSLWSPVRPETYYYDCFFYRQYPDRDSEYQEIEDKYNAIKQEKLDYSPPECDDDRIKAIVSGGSLNKSGGMRYTGLIDTSKTSAGKSARGGKRGGDIDDWYGPGESNNRDYLGEASMASSRSQKYQQGSGSKRNMVPEGDSVPCAELAEIRDLLKKSDRETIRRMQEMLTLMKELSVRDICRATCDGSQPGARIKTKSTRGDEDYMLEGSKARSEKGADSRKRKRGDVTDYGPQDSKKRHKQKEDDEGDDYGYQDRSKPYQRRDDNYGSMRSYQAAEGGRSPPESYQSYQRDVNSTRKMKAEYRRDDYNERQESEATYRQGKIPKRRKMGPEDEGETSIRSSRRGEPGRERAERFEDDGSAVYDEEASSEDFDGDPEPVGPPSLQRHPPSKHGRERLDADKESLSSSSESERSRSGLKREAAARRKGKKKDGISESDTDLSESSSVYSESSTTEGSRVGEESESDYESTDVESETPGEAGYSRSMPKRQDDGTGSSSQASLSVKGSASSLGKTRGKDRSRPGLYQGQKLPLEATVPGSSRALDQQSLGANNKIPVGKKNVPLTVHEVVELSNKITDIIVLEIIDEMIRRGIYTPPSSRYSQGTGPTMPLTSVETGLKSTGSKQGVTEPSPHDGTREPSGYKEFGRVEGLKTTHSPTRLSSIDESTAALSKDSKKDRSARDMKPGEKRRSGDSRRSSCPRHSKSLSPCNERRRRSSSCRLEIERRARSEGDRYNDSVQPRGPLKPWERRLSSQMMAESMRDSGVTDPARSDVTGSGGPLTSRQKIGTDTFNPPSAKLGQSSVRQLSVQRTLSARERPYPESGSPRSSALPENRKASIGSKTSGKGPFREPSAQLAHATLGDDIQPRPTLPRSKPIVADTSPTSSTQYSEAPQDKPPSRRGSVSSQMSKPGPSRLPSKQSDVSSLKDGRFPGSPRASMNSQMSKRSRKTDSRQRVINQDSSLSGNMNEAPFRPNGQSIPKEGSKSQRLLKDSSVIDPGQDVGGTGWDSSGQQKPTGIGQRSDKIYNGPRIVDQDTVNNRNTAKEPEVSQGKLVAMRTKETVQATVSERNGVGAMRGASQQSAACQPCQPDEFIATDYDTDNSVLYYARITSNAFPPVKETYQAAGFMLRSAYDYDIPPRSKVSVKTDLLLQLPRNSYGRIAPRKCLVENYGIDVGADVIDRDYRGNITVVLFNHGDRTFTVERGNKIAQLICESIHLAKVVENSNLLK